MTFCSELVKTIKISLSITVATTLFNNVIPSTVLLEHHASIFLTAFLLVVLSFLYYSKMSGALFLYVFPHCLVFYSTNLQTGIYLLHHWPDLMMRKVLVLQSFAKNIESYE